MSDVTNAKLRQMRDAISEQSDALATSIVQVDEQITDLSEQALAMETEITTPDQAAAVVILETIILIDKGGDYISYGSTFGDISWSPKGNLTDWQVIKLITPVPPPILPPVPTPIYTYTPGDYPDLDALVADYAFCNDYLTRPLYASGLASEASYGVYPTIVNLQLGNGYLTNNKSKVDASDAVFSGYIS